MERLLIVNADDFGLSKGQNYGIIEACRNGIVTSTTALVNGQAIDHAVQLSRDEPSLAIGMHFVLTMGKPLTAMPGLTRDGVLGKWIWQLAEEDALPLEEITQELASQYLRFIELFGRKPTHLDSHHHVHMFPQIFPIVARFAAEEGIALRADRQMVFDLPVNLRTTQGFSNERMAYDDENCSIVYNMWGYHGDAGFIIKNKTKQMMFVDLSKCFMVNNGLTYDYFQNRASSSSSSSTKSTSTG